MMKTAYLIPYDPEKWDLEKCFKKYGFCEWHQNNNTKPEYGDICYIYESHARKILVYKCKVTKFDMPIEDTVNQDDCSLDIVWEHETRAKYYMRLEPIKEISSFDLNCRKLREHNCKVFTFQNKMHDEAIEFIEEIIK